MNIEGMPEEERLAILVSLEAEHPGAAARAGGTLAGPATSNRPNVPIWDYEDYAEQHPDVNLEDLVAIRFPVVFHGGDDFTITSAAEHLRTDQVPPSTPMTLGSVVDLWRHLHTTGVVAWDSDRRAVKHRRPLDEYRTAVAAWGVKFRSTSQPRDEAPATDQ
jgi:hypothetical protein